MKMYAGQFTDQIFAKHDVGNKGHLDEEDQKRYCEENAPAMVKQKQQINGADATVETLHETLKSFDYNEDGKITKPEMEDFVLSLMTVKT